MHKGGERNSKRQENKIPWNWILPVLLLDGHRLIMQPNEPCLHLGLFLTLTRQPSFPLSQSASCSFLLLRPSCFQLLAPGCDGPNRECALSELVLAGSGGIRQRQEENIWGNRVRRKLALQGILSYIDLSPTHTYLHTYTFACTLNTHMHPSQIHISIFIPTPAFMYILIHTLTPSCTHSLEHIPIHISLLPSLYSFTQLCKHLHTSNYTCSPTLPHWHIWQHTYAHMNTYPHPPTYSHS